MKVYDAAHIRNIAVLGHGGDGKTTLVESILFNSGAIERRGKVEDGNTTTDYDPEEAKRQISLTTAIAPIEWKGNKINLIDAPGFFDFIGETTQAEYLADSALILVSGFSGVGVGAEKAYKFCKKAGKSMSVLINQMDKEHVDYDKVLDELKAKFGSGVTPIQVPVMDGGFKGFVDIIAGKAYEFGAKPADLTETAIPSSLEGKIEELREAVMENAASSDEALMEKYFEEGELSKEEILSGLMEGIISADIIPVFVGSGLDNKGIVPLMDAFVEYFPKASDAPAVKGTDSEDKEVEVARDNGAFAAQVMKTIADPFVGKINIFKILRGELTADTQLFNSNAGKAEKFSSPAFMFGKKLVNIEKLCAGDIGALAKLQFTSTGDSLCSATDKVTFPSITFGEPCISLAVTAKKQGEEDKVFSSLHKLEEEDPTFVMSKNAETGDMLVSGMGEMHIDVICQKLKNKFGVEAQLSEPRVAYRETIKKMAEAEGKHKKQSGGAGQFGVVQMRFEPILDGSKDYEFVNAIVGGVVPKEFIPAVEKGLKEALQNGVLAGFPMVNIRATLYDGKYHPVDSKEVAFKSAARLAYKAACEKANPVILEPIGKVEVTVPDEYVGAVIGDITKRRGRPLGQDPCEDGQKVMAEVPMSEMTKYATDLRSMTQGRGSFHIEFERYEELPANLVPKVVEQYKKDKEEE